MAMGTSRSPRFCSTVVMAGGTAATVAERLRWQDALECVGSKGGYRCVERPAYSHPRVAIVLDVSPLGLAI